MNRAIRQLAFGLAGASILVASPAFAQKAAPAPVTEAEKPARTAVTVRYICATASGYNSSLCTSSYQVPAGMRLVVQDIAIHAYSPSGQMYAELVYVLNGDWGYVFVPPANAMNGQAWAKREVPFYADALDQLWVYYTQSGTNPHVYVVGYLVKM